MSAIFEGADLTKEYEGRKIIEDVCIEVEEGEIASLLGVSGVGKSTLFNILSGLETPDKGKVILMGEDVTGKTGKVGYMQQSDLLLPFKKIGDNVMIPLLLMGEEKKEAGKKARKILEEFAIGDTMDMYPSQLSGGMRQRAALARTFLTGCNVMLLDEPFSALDAMTRSDMQKWFRDVVKKRGMSALFITHDIDEAIVLSDRIYILSGEVGKIKSIIVPGEDKEAAKKLITEKVK